MKSWKQIAFVLLSAFLLGNITACSGEGHVNDATRGSSTEEKFDEDMKNGTDRIEDGAEDLKDDVEDGAEDLKDDVEDALDGDGRTDHDR